MPNLSLVKTVYRELFTRERSPRVNEPDLVMDDPDKVAAYARAGKEDGVMAPVYLFHCAQICEVIRPGDTVLDLGCGPATQLGMVARVNPECQFIGMDLSPDMLIRARQHLEEQGLTNVSLRQGDITNLASLADRSVDAVMSTVALHHLPDVSYLEKVFSEIRRVLKPGGGVYLVDFGHLKAEKSIESFAYQYADRQAELFTLDYLYSLRAAFALEDFEQLTAKYLATGARVYSTFFMPYMVAVKSPTRLSRLDRARRHQLNKLRYNMPRYHQKDLSDLKVFFRLGGLRSAFLE